MPSLGLHEAVVRIKCSSVCRASGDSRPSATKLRVDETSMWQGLFSLTYGETGRTQCVWFPRGFDQVARPKDGLESFPWQIWKSLVLPSSRLHAASDRRAGITGGHSWQPIHFADSSISRAALSQNLASRLKAESCKAAGTWRNAGKLLPCEGQRWGADRYLFPLLSGSNSKCARMNSRPVARAWFVALVHAMESEMIGTHRTPLNRWSRL